MKFAGAFHAPDACLAECEYKQFLISFLLKRFFFKRLAFSFFRVRFSLIYGVTSFRSLWRISSKMANWRSRSSTFICYQCQRFRMCWNLGWYCL